MGIPKFSNLFGRIFAIFWLTISLVLIAVLLVKDYDPRQPHAVPEIGIAKLQRLAERLESRSADEPLHAVLETVNGHKRRGPDDKPAIYLSDEHGTLLGDINKSHRRMLQNFVTSLESLDHPQQRLYGRFMVMGPVPVKLASHDLLLYMSVKWEQTPPFLLQLFDRPFQLLLVVMLVSTPLLLWLAYALSQPARRLEKAAKRVANGEFETDISLEKGSSEFRQAGAAFNQMVYAINQMISGHQRLLSDISHELRSPLTRLRMANALASRKLGESAELTRIDTEAERLEKMIGELLELSRMQLNSHQVRESSSAFNLWDELLQDGQFEAEQVDKRLTYSEIPACELIGNPSLLMSAVENIVRNAIHYSHQQIQVEFSLSPNGLNICVEDDGDGVPESELQDIFRPFYRVSTARDRHSGGTGLGLAITESAIRQHNGTIVAEKSPLGGLKVTLFLPYNNQAI